MDKPKYYQQVKIIIEYDKDNLQAVTNAFLSTHYNYQIHDVKMTIVPIKEDLNLWMTMIRYNAEPSSSQ